MGKSVVIKYTKNGESFELVVDAVLAYEYVAGKRPDVLSVLETEEVFKDAKRAERQSEEKMKKVFGTADLAKVAETILKNSGVPISAEERAKMVDEKRRQIIAIIAKNSIDPRTNAPNPPLRIENAVNEAKVNFDPMKPAAEQVNEIVKKISFILPLKFTVSKVEVILPPDIANKCYGVLKRFGLKSEEWLPNGSLKAVVEFPAGMQGDFFNEVNKAAHGAAQVKML